MSELLEIVHNLNRLAELQRTALLDTPSEEPFDRLTRLATRLCKTPVALVSLVDRDRQFFKSAVGLPRAVAHQARDAAQLLVLQTRRRAGGAAGRSRRAPRSNVLRQSCRPRAEHRRLRRRAADAVRPRPRHALRRRLRTTHVVVPRRSADAACSCQCAMREIDLRTRLRESEDARRSAEARARPVDAAVSDAAAGQRLKSRITDDADKDGHRLHGQDRSGSRAALRVAPRERAVRWCGAR